MTDTFAHLLQQNLSPAEPQPKPSPQERLALAERIIIQAQAELEKRNQTIEVISAELKLKIEEVEALQYSVRTLERLLDEEKARSDRYESTYLRLLRTYNSTNRRLGRAYRRLLRIPYWIRKIFHAN